MRKTYVGLMYPQRDFEALKPFRHQLMELKIKCQPGGRDYMVLDEVQVALDRAAGHFTGDPAFYARKAPVGNGC
ncbi:hypothetical protein [Phenylobacterium ferrooxidans]|uniref:Uncharacterized protein n=1 Tax=Phenylobacterium ferrooxidans TaxID=2982689 RepID=A0ABW6CJR0_9CAUL